MYHRDITAPYLHGCLNPLPSEHGYKQQAYNLAASNGPKYGISSSTKWSCKAITSMTHPIIINHLYEMHLGSSQYAVSVNRRQLQKVHAHLEYLM